MTYRWGNGRDIEYCIYTHTTKRSLQHPQFPWSTRTSEWKSNASGSCDQSLQEQKAEPPEISRCSEATESCICWLPKKKTLSQRARRMLWNESMSDLKGISNVHHRGKQLNYQNLVLIVHVLSNNWTFTRSTNTSTYNKYIHILFLMQLPRQHMRLSLLPRRQLLGWKYLWRKGLRVQYWKISLHLENTTVLVLCHCH